MQWKGSRGSFNSPVELGKGPNLDNITPSSGVFNADSIFTGKNNTKWPTVTHSRAAGGQLWAMGVEYDNAGTRYQACGSTALTIAGISSPVQIGAYTNWAKISGSHYHGVNIKTDGTLWTSGVNINGILGKVTGSGGGPGTASKSALAQIGALTNWKLADCNQFMTAAVKTDGTLWTWGTGSGGKLGLGNTTNYSSPKQVGALTNWSSISVSKSGALASIQISAFGIKTDGTLWCWGDNAAGQLGLGNTTGYSSPKQVGSLTNWSSVISVGVGSSKSKTYAIKTDGTLWGWGTITYAASTSTSSPVQLGNSTWKAITTSEVLSPGGLIGIKTDGSLWALATSSNAGSSLLTGKNKTVYQFSRIGTSYNWKTVSSTSERNFDNRAFVVATKTDGTLWTWGWNGAGALGLGSTTNFSSPKQVGALTVWQDAFATRKRTMALRS
jgi:alpha-tubulin suppressor-like RCC1 family protein